MNDIVKFLIFGGGFALIGYGVGQFFGPLGALLGTILGFACVWALP
jgi:hypothetical protein